jgi:TRAP-type C4-dicarboxylate transport system permease small subunit
VSLIGRNLLGRTISGDFELVGAAAGGAIALFLPWCQVRRGNIIVDFFTTRASAAAQDRMDRLGALLFAAMLGLMAWRTSLGGLNAWRSNSGTMMMGFPEWIIYSVMLPPLVLCSVIGVAQALRGFATGDDA